MGLQDDYYNRQIMQKNHFAPILGLVIETMPRDNLLNSACLELFEYIKRENVKQLIEHLVENFRSQLLEITYVDTFALLIKRYTQMQEFNPDADTTLFSNDSTNTPNRTPNVNGNTRWTGVKEMDAAEEAYFNTSDEEDEPLPKSVVSKATRPNGFTNSPSLRPLVDYPDDDEDAMDITPTEAVDLGPKVELEPSPMLQTPPPERLSEKRRREEDNDEDELGKLSLSKRRNSGSPPSSVGGMAGHNTLKRKKGFKNDRSSPTNGKKIEISLSAKAASETGSKGDDGG